MLEPRWHARCASRLHFGLLAPDETGNRQFGGAGLMIEQPGIVVAARPKVATDDEEAGFTDVVEGPAVTPSLRLRALDILARLRRETLTRLLPPLHLSASQLAPEHQGFGTGTQWSLAVAALAFRVAGVEPKNLAVATGRGRRSGLGYHGFHHGGFLVDGGKGAKTTVAPLIARQDFPTDWPILLIRLMLPELSTGIHGLVEEQAFRSGPRLPTSATERLARLLWLEILPALAERDFFPFAEALYEFNYGVGGSFASVQGGPYAHPRLAECVAALRNWGVRAVGQTSWGPTLFAILADEEQLRWAISQLRQNFDLFSQGLIITRATNQGAMFTSMVP